jgi:hypothetical protein
MGQLYDLRTKIEAHIKANSLDEMTIKGKLGMRTGVLFGLITDKTPDDPAKTQKLKDAAAEILGLTL